MAKQTCDTLTAELFVVQRGRGRPPKDDALTTAERTARYRTKKQIAEERERQAIQKAAQRFEDYGLDVLLCLMNRPEQSPDEHKLLWLEIGRRQGWI